MRLIAELQADNRAEREMWGDLTDNDLALYIAGKATPELRGRVAGAMEKYPHVRSLVKELRPRRRFIALPIAAIVVFLLVLRPLTDWSNPRGLHERGGDAAAFWDVDGSIWTGSSEGGVPVVPRGVETGFVLALYSSRPASVWLARVNENGVEKMRFDSNALSHGVEAKRTFFVPLDRAREGVDKEWFVALYLDGASPSPEQSETASKALVELLNENSIELLTATTHDKEKSLEDKLRKQLQQSLKMNIRISVCNWAIRD
jgi:hypothetical protein